VLEARAKVEKVKLKMDFKLVSALFLAFCKLIASWDLTKFENSFYDVTNWRAQKTTGNIK
jgi:hypothetical protein